MEVKDWSPDGKESFTTPGGPFRRPAGGSEKSYSFHRPQTNGRVEPLRVSAREPSPFAPEAGTQPWYAQVEPRQQSAPVVTSHDGETQAAYTVQSPVPGGPQVYTIQLPPAPRQPAPKKRSLWWLPLALIAALLLGLALGLLCSPLLRQEAVPTQPTAAPDSESAARRIYREYVDSVVGITAVPVRDPAGAGGYVQANAGTGFLISEDGYLLTNAHVVADAEEIRVELSDGRQLQARLVKMEREASDLALLKIEAAGLHAVVLGDSDAAAVGDWVCTIGNPLGELSFSLTTGYLSAGPRRIDTGSATLTMLQTNAAFNKGNSGGPLFNEAGKVIAMVTAKLSAAETEAAVEGLGFALPINAVMELARAWMAADAG